MRVEEESAPSLLLREPEGGVENGIRAVFISIRDFGARATFQGL